MKAVTLSRLKLADELCFSDTFRDLAKKHFGEMAAVHCLDFRGHDSSFLRWAFSHSRAALKRDGLEDKIMSMIEELTE